jgi:hypothetical protein
LQTTLANPEFAYGNDLKALKASAMDETIRNKIRESLIRISSTSASARRWVPG